MASSAAASSGTARKGRPRLRFIYGDVVKSICPFGAAWQGGRTTAVGPLGSAEDKDTKFRAPQWAKAPKRYRAALDVIKVRRAPWVTSFWPLSLPPSLSLFLPLPDSCGIVDGSWPLLAGW